MSGLENRYEVEIDGENRDFDRSRGLHGGSSSCDGHDGRGTVVESQSWGSELERSKNGERIREREKDRHHHHKDRYDDRSGKDEKRRDRSNRHRNHDYEDHDHYHGRGSDRDNSDRYHNRGRSYARKSEFDGDKDRTQGQRSWSDSKNKTAHHSRSRSGSRSKSKRTSGFDMAPPGATNIPGAAVPGQAPAVAPATPGILPNMFAFGNSQFGALPLMPAQAMTQQATRHARRVYVGGLPPMANEQTIATFFSRVMSSIGGNTAGPGDSVVNVYINHEKKFAFVEMRTVEEASNAMALDGILFEGVSVRVRRPTDYNPSLAAALGPSQPNAHLNLSAVGLTAGAIGGAEGPDRIFVGGLPYYFTEAQIKELLESFGPLRGFDLVKDRDTGNSKGYGFCVYQDPAVTDVACAALNGLKMGDKTLTVRRATASTGQTKPDQDNILAQAQQHIAMQKMVLQAGGTTLPGVGFVHGWPIENPTKVICLTEVTSADELRDDDEYEEILEDMREEGGKFGLLVNVVIPRPSPTEYAPGVGKVFMEYADASGSAQAKAALDGRKFGGKVVTAVYFPEDKFYRREYE
ncbi:splicing factor U2af large subunit A-like isoform X2 [Aristolochia californica]|uniref:splicing factor U2af large subunit A-like isoform X2 n=1 Tax=Aristolochia californica TaxID=171875 RepID=UPI0035E2A8B6